MHEHHLRAAAYELQAAWEELLSPADSRILRVLNDLILHLEAQPQEAPQASEEQPAPTARVTTEVRSDADSVHELVRSLTEGTTLPTSPLQLLLGTLPREDRTHAERCSECRGLLDAFSLSLWMHVRAAELQTSTSRSPATSPSAATPSAAATSPSPSSPDSSPAPSSEARERLVDRMVFAYRADPVKLAACCDNVIDPTGALLGYLREVARPSQSSASGREE